MKIRLQPMGWGLFSWHCGQLAFVTIEKPNIGIMN